MEQFYKSNNNDLYKKEDIDFQIIEWWANDEEDESLIDFENLDLNENEKQELENKIPQSYTIRCFGVTKNDNSITCKINNFKPFFYVKVPNNFNRINLHNFLSWIESSYFLKDSIIKTKTWNKDDEQYDFETIYSPLIRKSCVIEEKKDLFGFRNGKRYKFVKLVFDNYKAMMKSRYIFKKPVSITQVTKKPTKYKLYESNIEPFMRFCHIKDILMAGWVKLPKGKWKKTLETSTTQIEVEIDWDDIISLKEHQAMANFLQASWDIEVYSHDGTFPEPKILKNEIFQIATTYKYYNSNNFLVKHLLTLKTCEPITEIDNDVPIIVECCENERDLIKRWVSIISKMDPDIFYTYNGDGFDCMYLKERAILHKLAGTDGKSGYFFNRLSRLKYIPAEIKKETFSSSAYGDSEYNRIYIPGRLNYDLLIHYKRGMKKYSSYKLDFIANEILKRGKHDVSAKQIFEYYKIGTPELIKKIGEYCIMDTQLLQELVDKQLILITIIQLANVTFVPIGFLTTRGQTIKVFSQILRKARQMNFLIPHTNFNEDSYSLEIKTYEPHKLDEDCIGEYIEIDCGKSQANRALKINGKITEILDETTLVAICDTEITHDFFNISFKYKSKSLRISRMCSRDDLIDDTFTGATVLNPKPGFYHEDNIAVLDFASLYPTIMISRNLCYSTFLTNDKYANIPGVKYEKIEWDDQVAYKLNHTCEGIGKSGKSKGQVCGKQAFFDIECNNPQSDCIICKSKGEKCEKHYYCRIHDPIKKSRCEGEKFQKRDVSYSYTIIQPHKDPETDEIVNKGVLPALLEELYAERKKVKRLMAKAYEDGNKLLADIYESTQLAIKVSLNSTYGFLGRRQGNLILKELGSIVTAVGRMLIEQSKEYVEGEFLEYVKENKLLTKIIKTHSINNLTEREKQKILQKFKIK